MAAIYPFRALRPPRDKVRQVAAVPYDVVSTEEARALAEGSSRESASASAVKVFFMGNFSPGA